MIEISSEDMYGVTIRAELLEAAVAFEVFFSVGMDQDSRTYVYDARRDAEPRSYAAKLVRGWRSTSGKHVTDLESAKRHITGTIRFDQCGNFDFDPEKTGSLVHMCDAGEAETFAWLFPRLYEIAKEMLGDRWLEK